MPTKKKEENGNGLFPSTFSVLVQSDNLLLHTFHFLQFFSLSDPISSSIFGCSCTITCFLFELWLLETKIISKNDHNCFGKDNTFSKRLESKVTIWWWRWTLTPSIPFRLRRLTRSMAANKKKKRRTGSQPRREPCFFYVWYSGHVLSNWCVMSLFCFVLSATQILRIDELLESIGWFDFRSYAILTTLLPLLPNNEKNRKIKARNAEHVDRWLVS